MTASLYQSGSAASMPLTGAASRVGACTSFIGRSSHVVVEIFLAAHPPTQPENVRRSAVWFEQYVIAPPAPQESLVAQQIMHLIRPIRSEIQRFDIQVYPAGLRRIRVQVDDRQYHIAAVGVHFQI